MADAQFFDKEFGKVISDFADMLLKTGTQVEIVWRPVPTGKEPAFEDIQKKYGKPDKTAEQGENTVMGVDTDLFVHWYGEIGFGVPKNASYRSGEVAGKVTHVVRKLK